MDAKSIVVGLILLMLLAFVVWFLYTRGVQTVNPPSQPLVPGAKK